jgi:hypothetical protein
MMGGENNTFENNSGFDQIRADIQVLIAMLDEYPDLYLRCIIDNDPAFYQRNDGYSDYAKRQSSIQRHSKNDRIFPLEAVEIQNYRTKYDSDIKTAIIHTGPYADEFTRSLNALAITLGTDIYFRNNAFNTGTEEGRKTIAHELTHVDQFVEKRTDTQDKGELEREAAAVEKREAGRRDQIMTIQVKGKRYSFSRKKAPEYADIIAKKVTHWIETQKWSMDGERYLRLLCAYQKWLGGTQ